MGVPAPNLVGQTFERLTVLAMVAPAPLPPDVDPDARRAHWRAKCRCACGRQTTVRVDHLRAGKIRSCGCIARIDLRGRRVGELLVLDQAENVVVGKSALTACCCQCACGRVVTLATYRLTRPDHASDCGCRSGRPPPPGLERAVEDLPETTISSAQWLRHVHDTSGIGALRVVGRSAEEDDDVDRVKTEFDPWAID